MSPRSQILPVAAAVAFALAAAVAGLCLGPAGVAPAEVFDALVHGEGEGWKIRVVSEYRLPGVTLGLVVGASLALAGVILQALLRNDLAEPYLVGVGPGAFLGVTVGALVLGAHAAGLPPTLRGGCALLGATSVSVLVFFAARRGGRRAGPTLLLGGVAIGAFVSAIATALLYVHVPDWDQVVLWLLGTLTSRRPADVAFVAVVLLVGATVAFVRARDLDAVSLGEEGAWLVGVHVGRLTVGLGLVACLLAAAAVSVSGLIGFVGLLVPHLARGWVGPGHRRLIPVAMALGGGLLVLADALARTAHPPQVIPVGVVTAALGAPFLTWVLLRRP